MPLLLSPFFVIFFKIMLRCFISPYARFYLPLDDYFRCQLAASALRRCLMPSDAD